MSNIYYQNTFKHICLIVFFTFFIGFVSSIRSTYALEDNLSTVTPVTNNQNTDSIVTTAAVIDKTEEKVKVEDIADKYKMLKEKLQNNEVEKKEAIIEHDKEVARQKAEEKRKKREKLMNSIVDDALSRRGCRYVWGATGPKQFDCSGLTQWAYRQNGISIPRVAAAQAQAGDRISKSNLKIGDLVFFRTESYSNRISHVGMYIGGGQFVHAPTTGDVVKISSLYSPYWRNNYAWACRYE